MFTVCPKCALTLAVTTSDLRIGQGYVRCGRCSNVFNALLTLSDEAARAATGPAGSPPRPVTPPPPAELLPPSVPLPAPQGPPPAESTPELAEHDASFEVDTVAAAEAGGTVTGTGEYRDTGTFETIVLEGDAAAQAEETLPEQVVDTKIAEVAQQIATPVESAPEHAADAPAERSPERRLAWGLGAAALVLLLAGQAVHHWRNDLAATPGLNGTLSSLYAAVGAPLAPRWNLAHYEVNQLGAEADAAAGNAINVRLSVMNHAEHAQPAPIVRLTLLDRYGKRLAARDLAPREYLASVPPGGFLAGGQRLDAQVAVRDPGPEASSFELDVCLPGPAGTLRCASDQPTVAARR